MKIPKTTPEKPYIDFSFDVHGKLRLKATSTYWGGINCGYVSTQNREGNTCLPKDLNKYIKIFKERKIKRLTKEIKELEKQVEKIKTF